MKKILLFAGATEGRQLAEWLSSQPVELTVSTATDYGASLLPEGEHITRISGRLEQEEMARLIQREQYWMVVDATHPYAQQAGENIQKACASTGTKLLRLSRQLCEVEEGVSLAADISDAVSLLNQMEGKALLTTGSKELKAFTQMKDFAQRIYPRVLPLPEVLAQCIHLGYLPSHIVAMQGPFSEEFNTALLGQTGCSILVTKNTGSAGGFVEKLSAARKAGAKVIVISPPQGREGLTLEQAKTLLSQEI